VRRGHVDLVGVVVEAPLGELEACLFDN
jgi:hypothetical protein